MISSKIIAAGVLVAGSVLGTGTALADDHIAPQIQWVNANVIVSATDHDVATVIGKYKCYGGNNDQTHLWVSVKQGPEINLTDHTSSQYAVAWYDTNWNSTPEGMPLTTLDCDGNWHVVRATVKNATIWTGAPFQQLTDGPALIQFCAFDSTGSEETGFASSYSMGTVHVPNNNG